MNNKIAIAIVAAIALVIFLALLVYIQTRPVADLPLVNQKELVFAAVGKDEQSALDIAFDLANRWPDKPAIVVIESSGIDLTAFSRGDYDTGLQTMLDYLAKQGLGNNGTTWLLFSEYNSYPGNPSPKEYVLATNRFAAMVKSKFPQSRTGVLLDCRSNLGYLGYLNRYGRVSLEPYLEGMDTKNVTEFFFQGFPRVVPDENITAPEEFLNASDAIAAAKILRTGQINFVTGTAAVYGSDGFCKISHSAGQRMQMADGICKQLAIAQQSGYAVGLVLFAENKSGSQADWSYSRGRDDFAVLKKIVVTATSSKIKVLLFDPYGQIRVADLAGGIT